MSLILVGLSHKNAPLGVRENLAVLSQAKVFERLREAGASEAVVLSTCNRYELYVCFNGVESKPPSWALNLLEKISGMSLSAHAYQRGGPGAVEHLFSVASGLDSLVVGETEILGQVKDAYEAAVAAKMTGKYSNVLFQRALYVGKKVRNDTGVAVGQTSTASVAVQLAETIFGSLRGSSVLILGAGSMAELTARHLQSHKVAELLISNRTFSRAAGLAGEMKAEAIAWQMFPEALKKVDIVVSSTGSEKPILTADMVRSALEARAGRSLFIIDIAMPRDVEEAAAELDHVYLYRLEDLESIVADNLKNRGGEVRLAQELVAAKAKEFCAWESTLGTGKEASLKHSEAV
ncbi:MAG: glutamyl-tRNA reductase [Elusimicrobia bacterium]|nr:glutamyl-tRNA reductase [Elusimicrobiota bacterium]